MKKEMDIVRNTLISRFYGLHIGEIDEIYNMSTDILQKLIDELEDADINVELEDDIIRLADIVKKYL
jgi:hypothetical protein